MTLAAVLGAWLRSPLLLLFSIIAVGYPLGRIKVGGFSLGVAAVLFATLSLTDGEAAGLLGVLLQEGPDALSALTPSRHAVVQGEFSQAFRAAFLTTAGFAVVACLLTWTIPLRRI